MLHLVIMTTEANEAAGLARESSHVASHDFETPSASRLMDNLQSSVTDGSKETTVNSSFLQSVPPSLKTTTNFDLGSEVDGVYARASNLIREALGAEGVMFLDANIAQMPKERTSTYRDPSETRTATSSSESDHPSSSYRSVKDDEGCPLLGFSTRVKSSLRGFLPSQKHLSISKSFLTRLVRKYPNGKIFNFDEKGSAYSSSGEEGTSGSGADGKAFAAEMARKVRWARNRGAKEAMALCDVFQGVQSVAFLPLWDVSRH